MYAFLLLIHLGEADAGCCVSFCRPGREALPGLEDLHALRGHQPDPANDHLEVRSSAFVLMLKMPWRLTCLCRFLNGMYPA